VPQDDNFKRNIWQPSWTTERVYRGWRGDQCWYRRWKRYKDKRWTTRRSQPRTGELKWAWNRLHPEKKAKTIQNDIHLASAWWTWESVFKNSLSRCIYKGGIGNESWPNRSKDSSLVSKSASKMEKKWEGRSEWSSLQPLWSSWRSGSWHLHGLPLPQHGQSLLSSQSDGSRRKNTFQSSSQSTPAGNLSCLHSQSSEAPPTQPSLFLPPRTGSARSFIAL